MTEEEAKREEALRKAYPMSRADEFCAIARDLAEMGEPALALEARLHAAHLEQQEKQEAFFRAVFRGETR